MVDAALTAGIFHYGIFSIVEVKEYLAKNEMRYESKVKY
jgi:imidazole glycerol phosphate synthase subunit HisF